MVLIIDIDGTIAELTKEQKAFVKDKSGKTWDDDYYPYLPYQRPIRKNIRLVSELMRYSFQSFFVTGRNEKYRVPTMNWLSNYFVNYQALLMRYDGDFRPNHEIKKGEFEAIEKAYGPTSYLVFEDDLECRSMYKQQGCFLVI